jgi:hypothetical protein
VGEEVWLEVHPPVDAEGQRTATDLDAFEQRLDQMLGDSEAVVHWDRALAALREASGMPTMIGLQLQPDPPQPEAAPPAQILGTAR